MSDCSTHAFEYPGIMRLERVEFDDGSIRRFDYPFVAVDKAIAKVVIDGIEYVNAEKLKATNGELCAEVNELQAELRKFKDMNNEVNAECAELEKRVAELESILLNVYGYKLTGEIVRCRDCIYYKQDPDPIDPGWPMMCERTGDDMVEPYGYCAWGERK